MPMLLSPLEEVERLRLMTLEFFFLPAPTADPVTNAGGKPPIVSCSAAALLLVFVVLAAAAAAATAAALLPFKVMAAVAFAAAFRLDLGVCGGGGGGGGPNAQSFVKPQAHAVLVGCTIMEEWPI